MFRVLIFLVSICSWLFAWKAESGFQGDFYIKNSVGIAALRGCLADIEVMKSANPALQDLKTFSFFNYSDELDFGVIAGYDIFNMFSVEASIDLLRGNLHSILLNQKGERTVVNSQVSVLSLSLGSNFEMELSGDFIPFIGGFVSVNRFQMFNADSTVFGLGGKAGVSIILKEYLHAYAEYNLRRLKSPSLTVFVDEIFPPSYVNPASDGDGNPLPQPTSPTADDRVRVSFRDHVFQNVILLGIRFII